MARSKDESILQVQCVDWFNIQHKGKGVLFAVPNGGSRNVIEAKRLKREGVLSGVSDLILIVEKNVVFIELKTPTTYKLGKKGKMIIDRKGGEQSQSQKDFQSMVEMLGFDYYLVDDFRYFQEIVNSYM